MQCVYLHKEQRGQIWMLKMHWGVHFNARCEHTHYFLATYDPISQDAFRPELKHNFLYIPVKLHVQFWFYTCFCSCVSSHNCTFLSFFFFFQLFLLEIQVFIFTIAVFVVLKEHVCRNDYKRIYHRNRRTGLISVWELLMALCAV